ncbi:MAG TPA: DMT family transporter [Burkholderiaceae bacterium]|nr:DMT family transporter [Burkholderiaceae bacterium]
MTRPPVQGVGDVRRAVSWMAVALVAFSVIAIAGREAMRSIGALELLFWRAGVGLAVLAGIHVAMRGTTASLASGQPALQAGRAVIHFGAQYSWLAALMLIPLVEVFALEFTAPLWVAILAPFLLGERLTALRAVAAVLGFAGALVVVWPDGSGPSPAAGFSLNAGSLLALASALGFAMNVMAVRRLVRTDRPFVLLVWMHALQLPLAAALAIGGPGLALSDARTFGWAALCGVAGLAAHYALSRASKLADAIVVAPMDFLRVPLIALVGVALYDEPLRAMVLAGVAFILAGNGLNVWSERRAARRR